MCKEYRWVISVAAISGVIQSLVWIGLGIFGALVYLCFLPIEPYNDSADFFRVTLIKLYFEGRKCQLDGSYLGQFSEAYKNEMSLIPPEYVFGVLIAYVILSVFFFVLSVVFYKRRDRENKRGIALGWSALSLLICAVDVLCTYGFVLDILTIRDYLSTVPENTLPSQVNDVPYIPLAMALVASGFIAGWLWNFSLGFIIFVDALCCRNIIREPPKRNIKPAPVKPLEKPKPAPEPPRKPPAQETPRGPAFREYFLPYGQDYIEYKNSMEATTRFNLPEKPTPRMENPGQGLSKPPVEGHRHPRQQYNWHWDMENEGYVSDEAPNRIDFDHDLKNFEPGQRKIKILKSTPGKSGNVPAPPPMPPSGSCNC